MKERYKKLLSTVLAVNVMLTVSACGNRDFSDLSAKKYRVEDGDTLSDIAVEYYGNEDYAQSIADYNGISNPDLIMTGDVIYLPRVENFVYYTIKPGDTLSNICLVKYGREDKEITRRLADYNRIKDPDLIKVGEVIIIPTLETLEMLYPSGPVLSK